MFRPIAESLVKSVLLCVLLISWLAQPIIARGELMAGAAKVDITETKKGLVNDRMYVRALVIKSGKTIAVVCTLDVVSIGEIGHIRDDFMAKVRAAIKKDLGIAPSSLIVNASHCHGIPRSDTDMLTVEAIKRAMKNVEPVTVGVGEGRENRIQENRRLFLKNGKELDVRHAYSLPPDDQVAGVGPIDPQIGILRLNRADGSTLAVVYNFAMHPIQGAANGGNTADITGFSSKVIEENLGGKAIALFVQGCGGDINPTLYKDFAHPRDGEPMGNRLGLSTLRGLRKIQTVRDDRLVVRNETLTLPRADLAQRIVEMEAEQERLLNTLNGTTLNLRNFLHLTMRYKLTPEFPSYHAHRYLQEKKIGKSDWAKLDADNRRAMAAYIRNIQTMEKLTQLRTNLRLLRMHQAQYLKAGKRTLDVEVVALRVGDFVMVTFPGELTVQIGLNIKKASPHAQTFVAGYTNGYIYYAPTEKQLKNLGGAQEDSDCILGTGWQQKFESKVAEMLKGI